ncbi:hypothetical protein ABDZ32_16170 [Aeromonas veronii]|uniref:hypothetical protein n=1 Tax=Aeromonas veronii TaxID=654 RepID=UPI0031FC7AC2
MQLIKDNWIRVSYILGSSLVFIISLYAMDDVVTDSSALNKFSYIGVVITIIALIIAISEVVHSISISKSIRDEAKNVLTQAQRLSGAAFISECLSVLDEANDHLTGERYALALKCFQHFRRTYTRISVIADATAQQINSLIRDVELSLQQSIHATPQAPIQKKKRASIQSNILTIKSHLEENNPV